jgi:hypothetical protein
MHSRAAVPHLLKEIAVKAWTPIEDFGKLSPGILFAVPEEDTAGRDELFLVLEREL